LYKIEIKDELSIKLKKLQKKNIVQFNAIFKKAEEIQINPHRYKNLRAPMNHLKRVHIDKHFVLTFSINEESKTVTLIDYDHHDNVY
jgi:YafQ family addiction module toxin component